MVRKFLAIVLTGILTFGTPFNALAQSSQLFSVQQTVLGTQTFHSADGAMEAAGVQMSVIGADDLAVVGTLVGLAASLKSLFSKTSDTDPEVIKGLTNLRQQNEKIIELLSKIIEILENMDVLLKGITRNAFIFDLRAEISTSMVQYYETRTALGYDPSYERRALERFRVQYDTLSRLSRKMMQYGFPVFDTVGTTMFFEVDLARRLQPKVERLYTLYTYRDYFIQAKDPKIDNSIGATKKYLEDVVQTANAILVSADQALGGQRRFFRGQYCGPNECDCGYRRTCFDTYGVINGDRSNGYSHDIARDNYNTSGSCRGCPIDRRITRLKDRFALSILAGQLPPIPSAPSPDTISDQKVVSLNYTRAILAEAKPQLDAVQKQVSTIDLYLEQIAIWIKEMGGQP